MEITRERVSSLNRNLSGAWVALRFYFGKAPSRR
jgi:hypothetical protein